LKLFRSFISHVTTSETEIELFRQLKECRDYFKIISATFDTLENILKLQYSCEIITQRRSIAKSVGCFQRCLSVCLFVCVCVRVCVCLST